MKKILTICFLALTIVGAKASERNYSNDLAIRTYTNIKNYFEHLRNTRKYDGLEGLYFNFGYDATQANYSSDILTPPILSNIPGADYNYPRNRRETGSRYDNFYIGVMYAININNYIIAPEFNKYVNYSSGLNGNYINYKINVGLDLSDKSTFLLGFGINRSKAMLDDSYGALISDYAWHAVFEPTYIYRFNDNYAAKFSIKLERGYNFEYTNNSGDNAEVKYDTTSYSIGFMYRF